MKGYKAFNKELMCRGMQYEIGKTYEINEKPICCKKGFHFCKNIADVYQYYQMSDDTRICEILATGDIDTDDDIKYCTNKIEIIKEIKSKDIKHCNLDGTDVGYCNSGNRNSGNWNSGDRNSGNRNSGDWNSGDWNSGNWNSGDWNSGDWNSGNRNSGDWNSGDWNSGNWNSGDWNSGNRNSGDWNSGDWNSGNRNSGDWNSGNCNIGVFNTLKNPKIMMFDKPSSWTLNNWFSSKAYLILSNCPFSYSEFITKINMSDEEKEKHPEYKTIGGYVKTITVTKKDKQIWWDNLPEESKEECYELPNFDEEKFIKCLGIEHI